MTSSDRANLEVAIAEAFGRPAPPWAVEEIGEGPVSALDRRRIVEEARYNVIAAQCFGRDPEPADVALAEQADAGTDVGGRVVTESALTVAVFEEGTRGARRRVR